MTFIEHTDNYVAQSLAHQLAHDIAYNIEDTDTVREIEYLRAGQPDRNGQSVSTNAVIMRFTNGMYIRIVDLRHPSDDGVWTADFGADGAIYNYGRRRYRRSDYPNLTDTQWRDIVVSRIAADCSDIAALRGAATQPGSTV